MKNTTHRVVILKRINSSLIAQAILILKDGADTGESAVLREAEKIVEKYMKNRGETKKKSNPLSKKLWLGGAVLFVIGGVLLKLLV